MTKFIETIKTNQDFKMKVVRGFLFFLLANAFMLFVSFKVPSSNTEEVVQEQTNTSFQIDDGMNKKITQEDFTYDNYEKEMIHQNSDINIPSVSKRKEREENNASSVKSYIEKRRAQQEKLRNRKSRTSRRVVPKRNYRATGSREMWQERKRNNRSEKVIKEKEVKIVKEVPKVEVPLTKEQKIQRALNNSSTEEVRNEKITVRATIDHNQIILNGGNVNMRLLEDLKMGNTIIPEDTSVYGTCRFQKSGRVDIEVHSISYKRKRIPIKLVAYDYKDAQQGLIVGSNAMQDAISEEAKDETDKEIRSTGRVGGIVSTILKKTEKTTKIQLYDEHWLYLKQ